MKDPLDPQCESLYRAEEEVFDKDKPRIPLRELRKFASEIQQSSWWLEHFPAQPPIAIKDGRGSEWSRANDGSAHIPREGRRKDVVVHELCHVVMPCWAEWHGELFAGLLLWMYAQVFGQPASDGVRKAMRRRGVRWDRRAAKYGP